MAIVTALRAAGRDRVAVELDGRAWRALPLEAVVRAGLTVDRELDRAQLRTLARERRRLVALTVAAGALRHRSLSKRGLDERLRRRGVAPTQRARTVETLQRAGLVDDERLATSRAASLADRGYGNAYILDDLERRGVAEELAREAIDALETEAERAARELARRGGDLRAMKALARRGFSEDSLEHVAALIARDLRAELG